MALNGGGAFSLGVKFSGSDVGLGSSLKSLSGAFEKMKEAGAEARKEIKGTFAEFKAGLGPLQATIGAFRQLDGFAGHAATMQKSMKQLEVVLGSGSKSLEKFQEEALSSKGAMLGFNADQSSETILRMGRVLGDTNKALAAHKDALVLARIGEVDAAEAGGALARAIRQFKLEANEGSQVTDTLALGMRRFGLENRDSIAVLNSLSSSSSVVRGNFQDTALAAFLVGRSMTDMQKGASDAASAVEAMAKGSNDKMRAFVRDGRGGVLSLTGAMEKLLRTNPAPTMAQLQSGARAAGLDASFFGKMYTQLNEEVVKSGGRFKNARDALRGLGKDMQDGKGLGEQFAKGMTGAGQITTAAWEKIKTAIAAPLRTAFAPIHQGIARAMLALLDFVNSIPGPIKKALADFVVMGLKLGLMFGSFMALRGGVMLVITALTYLAPLIGGLIVTFAPLIAQFLLAIAVFEGLKYAYEKNLGGIRDFFLDVWGKIKLAWDGIMQVFSTGELSGAVLDEMEKTKNKGVLEFVVFLYSAWARIKNVIDGIREGFQAGMEAIEPSLTALRLAWSRLVDAFGGGGDGIIATIGRLPFDSFRQFGKVIGDFAAKVVDVIVNLLGYAFEYAAGFVRGFRAGLDFLLPVLSELWASLKNLWTTVKGLLSPLFDMFGATKEGGSAFGVLGDIMGTLVSGAMTVLVGAITAIVKVIATTVDWVKTLIGFFYDFGEAIGRTFGRFFQMIGEVVAALKKGDLMGAFRAVGNGVKDIFLNMVDFIRDQIDRILGFVARALARIPGLRTKFKGFIEEQTARDELRASGVTRGVERKRAREEGEQPPGVTTPVANGPVPLVPLETPSQMSAENAAATMAQMQAINEALTRIAKGETPTFNLNLDVDGKAIAAATNKANGEDRVSSLRGRSAR